MFDQLKRPRGPQRKRLKASDSKRQKRKTSCHHLMKCGGTYAANYRERRRQINESYPHATLRFGAFLLPRPELLDIGVRKQVINIEECHVYSYYIFIIDF